MYYDWFGATARHLAINILLSCGVAGLVSHARAADLGGDCCADLEARVAELETAALRKGTEKVSVTLYGKANKAVLFWDDGALGSVYVVDSSYESTRFGFKGSAKISADWSAGFRLEIEDRITASQRVSQFDAGNFNQPPLNVRWSSLYLNNVHWGELRWGYTATPKYDITKDTNIFVPNLLDTTSSDHRMNQNFRLRPEGSKGVADLSTLTWSNISRCYSSGEAFNCSTRRPGIAYWSPDWEGFSSSVGYFRSPTHDDVWGAALRYKKDWGRNFQVGAGIGYEDFHRRRRAGSAILDEFDEWAGMANIRHKPTGLFLYSDFSFSAPSDTNTRGIFTKQAPPDMSAWDVWVGVQRKMPRLGLDRFGETAFWGGFGNIQDGFGGVALNGFLPAGTFANVPVDTQITGADVDRWFLAVDQWIDSAAIQLYAVYQHLDAEVDLVDKQLNHVAAPLEDFDLFYTGAIIYF
jgi:predicted porin